MLDIANERRLSVQFNCGPDAYCSPGRLTGIAQLYPDVRFDFAYCRPMDEMASVIAQCDIVPRANHTCTNLDHACSAAELERALSDNKELFNRNWEGKMPKPEDKVCDIGVARLYLNAKGNYYPCDCMHEYVLGNVRENTLAEIWSGEKLNYLRSLKNKDFGKCASCENRPWCKVCPAANFNATGDLFKTIPEKCVQSAVIHKIYGGK